MRIDVKSVGVLVDELITVDIKCYGFQEVVCRETDDKIVADAARKAQALNARRNQLIAAIDKAVGTDIFSPTEKSYG